MKNAARCQTLALWLALASALPASATTSPLPCALGDSAAANVTIRSCTYARVDSEAGNPDYYLALSLTYQSERTLDAVRFVIQTADGRRSEVDRQHVEPGSFAHYDVRIIAPSAGSITVWADAAS